MDWTKFLYVSPSLGNTPTKKDPNLPQLTPLEKHIADLTGPARIDGSDKFFGFENVRLDSHGQRGSVANRIRTYSTAAHGTISDPDASDFLLTLF